MMKRINEIKNIVLKHKSYRSPNAEVAAVVAEEIAVALSALRTKQAAHLVAEEAKLDAYGKTIKTIHTMVHPDSVAVKKLHLAAIDTSVLRLQVKECQSYEDYITLASEMRTRGLQQEADKLSPFIQQYRDAWMADLHYQEKLADLESKASCMSAPNMLLNGDLENITSQDAKSGRLSFTPLQDLIEQAVAYDTTLSKMVIAKMDTVPQHNPMTPQFQQKLADLSQNQRYVVPSVDAILASMSNPKAQADFIKAADAAGLEHGPAPVPVQKKRALSPKKTQQDAKPYIPEGGDNDFGEGTE